MERTRSRGGLFALMAILCTFTLALLALAGCGGNQESASSNSSAASSASTGESGSEAMVKANIGYWGGTCEAPIMVAEALGYFEQCGVDANVFVITTGTSELVANHDIDFFEATPNLLPSMYQGLQITFVDNIHTGCIQGVARPDSGITSYADLPGHKVGMFSEGDMAQLFIQAEMAQNGIDYEDTQWLAYSDGGAAMAFEALRNGEIDALTWFDPYGEIGELAGYTKFFNNATDPLYKDCTCCFLAATDYAIENNPEAVVRVTAAMQMARDYLTANPAEAAKIIQNSGYVAESDTILESYGISDTSEDLHERLLKSYNWCAGDEEMFNHSAHENWSILYYGTDLMSDAPQTWGSGDEYEAYITDLNNEGYRYYGAEAAQYLTDHNLKADTAVTADSVKTQAKAA